MIPRLKNKRIMLIITSFITVALISFYLGSQHPKIDYSRKIEAFVSCIPYEESFLQSIGFKDRSDCVEFNRELEDEYRNDCVDVIKKTDNKKFNNTSLESCIYHAFSRAKTSFDSNYYIFKHPK